MDVGQAGKPLQLPLEVIIGECEMQPPFLIKLLAPLFKSSIDGPKPFVKNSRNPFPITDHPVFETVRAKLLALLRRISEAGPAAPTRIPHPLLGKLTPSKSALER